MLLFALTTARVSLRLSFLLSLYSVADAILLFFSSHAVVGGLTREVPAIPVRYQGGVLLLRDALARFC
jgi:hypothetical protein